MSKPTIENEALAAYVVCFLRKRNRGQLDAAFASMRVSDYELMVRELAHVLHHGGHPPNWSPLESEP